MTSRELAEVTGGNLTTLMPGISSPALQIMLDDRLFERAKLVAKYMSDAQGFTPRHLIGHTEACFAVVCRSITWKLDPWAVACCTYQTPGGAIGYEGKLVQAILENSGKFEGPIRYEHFGDWSMVEGKFKLETSQKGNKYTAATWNDEDAKGLGVIVRGKVVGEIDEREWPFLLVQAQPRNSTLWATDPRTQICYTAVRRFANVAAPGILMGVPFDREDWTEQAKGAEHAKDITPPAPQREDYTEEEGSYTAADGATVPEGKSLRQHYAEGADKALAASVPDLDAGDGPENPDETDDETEPASGETDGTDEGPGEEAAAEQSRAQPPVADQPSARPAAKSTDSGGQKKATHFLGGLKATLWKIQSRDEVMAWLLAPMVMKHVQQLDPVEKALWEEAVDNHIEQIES